MSNVKSLTTIIILCIFSSFIKAEEFDISSIRSSEGASLVCITAFAPIILSIYSELKREK